MQASSINQINPSIQSINDALGRDMAYRGIEVSEIGVGLLELPALRTKVIDAQTRHEHREQQRVGGVVLPHVGRHMQARHAAHRVARRYRAERTGALVVVRRASVAVLHRGLVVRCRRCLDARQIGQVLESRSIAIAVAVARWSRCRGRRIARL